MMAYEQTLRLFERWCMEEMKIVTVDKVTENVIRRYIAELQERGNHQQLHSQSSGVLQLSGTQLHNGVVVSMIFGKENHRYPSHYDLHIKMFHSTE